MIEITSPVLTSHESADLVVDQEGNPIVRVSFDVEDDGEFNFHEDTWTFFLEPLQARRLALSLLHISQQGINAEIELERSRKEGK